MYENTNTAGPTLSTASSHTSSRALGRAFLAGLLVVGILFPGPGPVLAAPLGGAAVVDGLATTAVDTSAPDPRTFDGFRPSTANLSALCNDEPVVGFGFVFDDAGQQIPDELWVALGRGEKAVYYHLTDIPGTGPGTQCGYVAKLKVTTRVDILNYGEGSDIPMSGSDDDAFVIATADIRVNPAFAELGALTVDIGTGEIDLTRRFELLGSYVLTWNMPRSTTAQRGTLEQWIAPDGVVEYEFSQYWNPESPSEPALDDFCDAFGESVSSIPDVSLTLLDWLTYAEDGIGFGAILGVAGATYGSTAGAAAALGAGSFAVDAIIEPVRSFTLDGLTALAVPAAQGVSTLACRMGRDLMNGALLDLGDLVFSAKGITVATEVCDAWVTVAVDGDFTEDTSGDIPEYTTETGFVDVCVRSHVEYNGW